MTFAKWTRPHSADDAETWSESDLAPTLNGFEQREGGESTPPVLVTEPLMISENQRAEVRLTDYARQLTTGGGKPGQGYPTVLMSETPADEPIPLDARQFSRGEKITNNRSQGSGGPPGTGVGNAGDPAFTVSERGQAISTSSTADSRARTSAWPVNGPAFGASAALSGLSLNASCPSCGHGGALLKMFPDSFPPMADGTFPEFSWGWSTSGMGGPTGFWTRGGSESPSGADASSLSDVLETRPVPRRYWLVCESCGGHPATGREAGEDIAPALDDGARGTSDGHGNAWNTTYVNGPVAGTIGARSGNTRADQAWTGQLVAGDEVSPTLVGGSNNPASHGKRNGSDRGPLIAATLSSGGHPGSNMPGRHKEDDENLVIARTLTTSNERIDAETENLLVASTDRASDGHHGHSSPRGDGSDNLLAFDANSSVPVHDSNVWPTLRHGTGLGIPQGASAISGSQGVRRLTPKECERLMAFPDDWTRYTADGREISDSHRYRMCGNGVVSTVAEWLGYRLLAVDTARHQEVAA